jgi:hypothetical protein
VEKEGFIYRGGRDVDQIEIWDRVIGTGFWGKIM